MSEYFLEIGLDGNKSFKGLKDTIDVMELIDSKAGEVGKSMETAFEKGSKATENFEKKLINTSDNIEAVKEASILAGKSIETMFDKGVNTSKVLSQVNDFKKKLKEIDTNKKIGIAIDPKSMSDFQNALNTIKGSLPEIKAEIQKQMSFFDNAIDASRENINVLEKDIKDLEKTLESLAPSTAKLDMEQELKSAVQALKEERAILEQNNGSLREFDNLNRELVTSISQANKAVHNFEVGSGQAELKVKTLKGQLREMKAELAELEMQGLAGSERFRELSERAGELEDQIGDTNAQIKILASDTATFDALIEGVSGLVGAFAIGQGALALFGVENEEVERALLKVNSAMAILQGLQQISNTLNKDSAFSVIFLRNAQLSQAEVTILQTEAQTAHASAVVAETLAVEALAVADAQLASATLAVTVASEAHTVANTEETASALASAQASELEAIALRQTALAEVQASQSAVANTTAQVAQTGAMTGATIASRVLKFALASLGIGLVIIAVALLVEWWDDLVEVVEEFLPAGESVGKIFDKIKSYALGVGNAILQFVIAPLKALYELISTGDIDRALNSYMKSVNVISNFNDGFRAQESKNNEKYRNEQEQANIDFAKRELERRKNRGEDVFQLEQRLRARQLALNKRMKKEDLDLMKEYEDEQDKKIGENNKKAEDARKKAEEKARKDREEAEKKAIEQAKKNNELTIKYIEELSKLRLDSQEKNLELERQVIDNDAKLKIEALRRDGATSAEAIKAREDLILGILEKAEFDKNEISKKYDEINQKKFQDQIKNELEVNGQIESLRKDSLDKELSLLTINAQKSLDAINEKFKDDEKTRIALIEATEKNVSEKEEEIKKKYADKALKTEEERALLGVELSSQYADKSVETERQKQIALLTVKLYYAELALMNIKDDGTEESRLQQEQAKNTIKGLREGLEDATNGGEYEFDMFKFLGLGNGLSDEDQKGLRRAIAESMKVLSDYTSFMIDNYQEQMDAKREQADAVQEDIDDLEDQLDDEKELRENGFANNVEVIEAEIAEKQRQKDELQKQEEEALEKKKQMQKLQLAIDTASQISGLITSSVNIIQGFSTIPIVGVPLGIAMVGLMLGAFVASKAKALQSINQQKVEYGEGGEITGRSHAQGGMKYISEDGSKVKELEDGEFVVRKKQYGKFGSVVRAINNNDFSQLSVNDYAVAEIFRQMGFDFDAGVDEAKNLQLNLMSMGYSQSESKHLAEISSGIAYLVESDKNTPKTYELDGYSCTKIGSVIKKRPINKKPKNDENDTDK